MSHSTDGGDTWSRPTTLSSAFDNPQHTGRQGCSIRTDSKGTVYAVWEDSHQKQAVFKLARSFDGGVSFEKPRTIANVTDVGIFDGVRSISFDGIAGARTSSFPSLEVANGAPTGAGASDKLALGWSDGADGLNHEHALVQFSTNGGQAWTTPVQVEQSGDRPDFAFIGLSPNGQDLYVVYDGFLDPFRTNTTSTRRFVGVTRHADVSGTTPEQHRDGGPRTGERSGRRPGLQRKRADRRVHRRLQHGRGHQRGSRVGVQRRPGRRSLPLD